MAIISPSLIILSCCIHLESINGENILAVFPFPYRSHMKTFQPLIEEILKRGHSLTLLSSLPLNLNNELQQNFTNIKVEKYSAYVSFETYMNRLNTSVLKNSNFKRLIYYEMEFEFLENMINDPEVQELFRSKNNYDLVIAELFGSEVFFVFGNKFHAPVMSVSSQSLCSYHKWILDNPNPSYFPNSFLEETENMSFVSRAINMGWNFILILYFEFYHLPNQQSLIDKYVPLEESNSPTLKEMMINISVSLVNTHHSFGYAQPYLPNTVNVAGIHFTSSKPLPLDLQKFMDEAEWGVIYLSLGSLIDPNSLEQLGISLINVLKVLPQRVIMKWNMELLPHVPSNVLVREWLPQSDILNHPNCRLFITHGGYLSLLESLNASVPVLGVPFFGDQPHNIAMVEYFELGKKIELENDIALDLPAKIIEVLNNPKYKQNMERRSIIFRNRPASPLDTAMYWVDHVLKRKDTSHLKSTSVRLKGYKLYSVDIFGILIVLMGVTVFTMKFILLRFISSVLGLFAKSQKWCNIKSRQRVIKNNFKND